MLGLRVQNVGSMEISLVNKRYVEFYEWILWFSFHGLHIFFAMCTSSGFGYSWNIYPTIL